MSKKEASISFNCSCCGKRVETHATYYQWGYAYGSKLACSYSCQRKLEKSAKMRKIKVVI